MGARRVGDPVHASRLDTLGLKGPHRIVAPGALQSKTPGFRALRTLLIGRVALALWWSSLGRRPTDNRIVGIAAWSRRVDGCPVDFGKWSAGREPLN